MNKSAFHLLVLSSLIALFGLSLDAHASASSGEVNRTDGNGLRQGFWIIKGYMVDEPGYSANVTVEEGHYINGTKEGHWKRYYPSGQLRNEITYRNGTPYGPYTIYYPNGQIEERGNWHRNKNVGEFERFYEDGQKQQEFYFSDSGKRNGTQTYYHDNGQIALVVDVINGKEDGEMHRFNPDGKLKETKVLSGGELEPGSIRKYRNAPHQRSTVATENASLTVDAVAEEAQPNDAYRFEPNGHNILYNKAQQITQAGEFKNGRLHNGRWYRYNPNGLLVKIEIYQEGRYLGTGVIDDSDK